MTAGIIRTTCKGTYVTVPIECLQLNYDDFTLVGRRESDSIEELTWTVWFSGCRIISTVQI